MAVDTQHGREKLGSPTLKSSREVEASGGMRGSGLVELRGHNRAAVLSTILYRGPLARKELAEIVGLPPSVLSYITSDLLAAQLIEEHPGVGRSDQSQTGESTAVDEAPGLRGTGAKRGRHPVPLSIARFGEAYPRCAIGVHIGAARMVIGLVDLRAGLISRRVVRINHAAWGRHPDGLVRELTRQINALVEQHEVPSRAVLGVGVGVAGWVDGARGVVRRHAQLGWTDVELSGMLRRALVLPVVIDDHVRAMATAEAWFGGGRAAETMLFLYVSTAVRCAVVIGGHVHRGHHSAAGSIGFLRTLVQGGERPVSQEQQDGLAGLRVPSVPLEEAASEAALLEQARRLAKTTPDELLGRWAASAPEDHPGTDGLASRIDPNTDHEATALLRGRATALAAYVAPVVATLDPQLLVVAGAITWDPALYQLKLLRDTVIEYAPELAERLPLMRPSAFGRQITAVSPAALVLREVYTPPLAAQGCPPEVSETAAHIRRRAFAPQAK